MTDTLRDKLRQVLSARNLPTDESLLDELAAPASEIIGQFAYEIGVSHNAVQRRLIQEWDEQMAMLWRTVSTYAMHRPGCAGDTACTCGLNHIARAMKEVSHENDGN